MFCSTKNLMSLKICFLSFVSTYVVYRIKLSYFIATGISFHSSLRQEQALCYLTDELITDQAVELLIYLLKGTVVWVVKF